MALSLKPLNQQVIAITGASSGIGLATAKMAAENGAKVFMISRNEDELRRLRDELVEAGGNVEFYATDVADEASLAQAAQRCIDVFGRIDTWVNNAGLSIYGKVLETPTDEARRLFETNFWGVFHGCKAAIPHLRKQGGALINIGSVLSEVGLSIQGIYSASKFAVKGLTDALRRELEAEGAPIAVTLVKPGAIDTPYTEHARSRLGAAPTHTPPVYAPEVVARAILSCATKPVREIGVGASSLLYPLMDRFFPRITDLYMSRRMMEKQQSRKEPSQKQRQEAIHRVPEREGDIRGDYSGHVMKSSIYTEAALRPWIGRLVTLGIAGAIGYRVLTSEKRAA